jgi:hypothetical protein
MRSGEPPGHCSGSTLPNTIHGINGNICCFRFASVLHPFCVSPVDHKLGYVSRKGDRETQITGTFPLHHHSFALLWWKSASSYPNKRMQKRMQRKKANKKGLNRVG